MGSQTWSFDTDVKRGLLAHSSNKLTRVPEKLPNCRHSWKRKRRARPGQARHQHATLLSLLKGHMTQEDDVVLLLVSKRVWVTAGQSHRRHDRPQQYARTQTQQQGCSCTWLCWRDGCLLTYRMISGPAQHRASRRARNASSTTPPLGHQCPGY